MSKQTQSLNMLHINMSKSCMIDFKSEKITTLLNEGLNALLKLNV